MSTVEEGAIRQQTKAIIPGLLTTVEFELPNSLKKLKKRARNQDSVESSQSRKNFKLPRVASLKKKDYSR